jgi:hypothetical protein
VGLHIIVDEDFSLETRKTRRGFIPYLKDAKKNGLRALVKKDKLLVNGQIDNLDYVE